MNYGLILLFGLYIITIKGLGSDKISPRTAALIISAGVYGFNLLIQIILGQLYLLPLWHWFTLNQVVSFLVLFGFFWIIFYHMDKRSDDSMIWLALGTAGFIAAFYLPTITPNLLHSIGIN